MNVGATVESEDDGEDFFIRASVSTELSLFQKEKGWLLCDDDGNYLCPLEWWKLNSTKYPHVWALAERVLSIPSTSAPSEHLFSAASNIINKKRSSLLPQNADMLLFFKANVDLIKWWIGY